jgi:hypothetical protein
LPDRIKLTATTISSELKIHPRFVWFTRRRLFFIILIFAALFYAQFRLWELPVRADRANWDYFAQVVARGGVPYRDVVNIKSPLSAYLSAAAILATRPFGLRDIYAIRGVSFLMIVLTVALVFLVANDYFGSRRKGLLAALIMLAFQPFAILNAGTQPKTPMILFGLITLWAILKDKPFTAGLLGMLSALCWQPGLLFVGAAGLAGSRYLTSWRDGKVMRVIAGAALPLFVALFYFWLTGALHDFYMWSFDFNRTVYGPREMHSVSSSINRMQSIMQMTYPESRYYFGLGLLGFFLAIAMELVQAAQSREKGFFKSLIENAPRQAMVISATVYFLFCLIDMQGNADTIPMLPFIAIFAAALLVYAIDIVIEIFAKLRLKQISLKEIGSLFIEEYFSPLGNSFRASAVSDRSSLLNPGVFLLICIAIFLQIERGIILRKPAGVTIARQDAEVAKLISNLQPDDKIFVQGRTEILVLAGLTNASKYYFMDRGKDSYLDKMEAGGFAGWFERLKAERPKVVALSRMKMVDHKADFYQWVRDEYDLYEDKIFTYYVRHDGNPKTNQLPANEDKDEDEGDN